MRNSAIKREYFHRQLKLHVVQFDAKIDGIIERQEAVDKNLVKARNLAARIIKNSEPCMFFREQAI